MSFLKTLTLFTFVTSISAVVTAVPLCRNLFDPNNNQAFLTEQNVADLVEKSKSYQDKRNKEWAERNKCLCCHTTLPYMLGRGLDVNSKANFEKFKDVAAIKVENPAELPWYHADMKGRDSKPTEAVLNALTLVMYDIQSGVPLTATTLKAMDSIFAKVESNGRLHWLDFELQPFESKKGELWGNSMALLAIEIAKKNSDYQPPTAKYNKLKAYILNKSDLLQINEMSVLLWANSQSGHGQFLTAATESKFLNKIIDSQNENGSFNQDVVLGFGKREDNIYATAISLIGLIKAGYGNHPTAHRAAKWLASAQSTGNLLQMGDGTTLWPSISMNRTNVLRNDRFASDYSTSYSALALSIYKSEVLDSRP